MNIKILLFIFLISSSCFATTFNCYSVSDITNALKSVKAGDEIIIHKGIYNAKKINNSAYFFSEINGTSTKPIIIRSAFKNEPVILKGDDLQRGTVLRITGDFWIVKDLSFTNAQKGLVLDTSNNSKIINCNVYKTANEAIHIRDNSNNTLIDKCKIHETGLVNPGFGEGIYIGSDKGSWKKYSYKSNNTTITNCEIGPYVSAESIDIKEGTQGTIIKNNKFIGLGISGENSAKSFISIKGINNKIFSNIFDAKGEENLKAGITNVYRGTKFSGYNNYIYNNTFKMSDEESYLVKANSGTSKIYAINNKRIPEGKKHTSQVIEAYPEDYLHKISKNTNKYIILKFDDLRGTTNNCYNKNWQKLVNTIRTSKIKASIGIIAKDLVQASQVCKDSITKWHNSPHFEIWHHGWDHKRNNYGANKNNKGEYKDTSYEFQKSNFEKAIQFAKTELNIEMKTFGAPYNQTDSIFSRVIKENKNIKVWLYAKEKFPYNNLKLIRGKNNKLESKTGVVNFDSFLQAYHESKNEYLVLQAHPGMWNSTSFYEFNKVIEFLKKQNVIFTLPYEYYLKKIN